MRFAIVQTQSAAFHEIPFLFVFRPHADYSVTRWVLNTNFSYVPPLYGVDGSQSTFGDQHTEVTKPLQSLYIRELMNVRYRFVNVVLRLITHVVWILRKSMPVDTSSYVRSGIWTRD